MPIQGSNASGATWTTFATTGTPSAGWNTLTLTEPVAYEALRISGGNGYCNAAELQFIIAVIDKTDLAVHLDDARLVDDPRHCPRRRSNGRRRQGRNSKGGGHRLGRSRRGHSQPGRRLTIRRAEPRIPFARP